LNQGNKDSEEHSYSVSLMAEWLLIHNLQKL